MNLYSLESEAQVLAAALLDREEWDAEGIPAILEPQDFYREHHGWLYQAILERRGHDPTALGAYMDSAHRWKPDGGWSLCILELWGQCFTAHGIEAHARYVANLSFSRQLVEVAARIARLSSDRDGTPWVILDSALLDLESLRSLARRAAGIEADPFLARRGTMPE